MCVVLASVGCSAPQSDTGAMTKRSPRAPAAAGLTQTYQLRWGDREVGREVVAVSREAGLERWVGEIEQWAPTRTNLRWTVLLDADRREPAGFEVELEIAEARLRTQAWRDQTLLRYEREGFGRTDTGALGYGAGTGTDLGTPLSAWWALRELVAAAPSADVDIRTFVVRPPELAPQVRIVRWGPDEAGAWRWERDGERTRIELDEAPFPAEVVTRRSSWPRALRRVRAPVQ